MPAATSSRRKVSRRQNSEDIEESRSSQARRPHDDVSDDDQPVVKVKHEKKSKKRIVQDEDEDDPSVPATTYDDDDDDGAIDVANFSDQPLSKADMAKVGGMASDWESMASQVEQHFSMYKDIGAATAETGEKSIETSKPLQALDSEVREFFDVCAELRIQAQSLDSLRQSIAREDHVVKPHAIYESKVQELLDEYAGKTSRQKYSKNKNYLTFHTAIWEVHNPDSPMPPLTDLIPKEDGDDSDDEDVEMGGVTQNYLCPLTLTLLEDPVTSKICGHSYSKANIDAYCESPTRLYQCPQAGCNKSFRRSDCEKDKDLAKKIKKRGMHKDAGINKKANVDDDDEVVE